MFEIILMIVMLIIFIFTWINFIFLKERIENLEWNVVNLKNNIKTLAAKKEKTIKNKE